MDRDELDRRYKQAQLHAAAQAAETQAPEQPQADTEPEAPAFTQSMVQAAGINPPGLAPYVSNDDRLRRWAGLQ